METPGRRHADGRASSAVADTQTHRHADTDRQTHGQRPVDDGQKAISLARAVADSSFLWVLGIPYLLQVILARATDMATSDETLLCSPSIEAWNPY